MAPRQKVIADVPVSDPGDHVDRPTDRQPGQAFAPAGSALRAGGRSGQTDGSPTGQATRFAHFATVLVKVRLMIAVVPAWLRRWGFAVALALVFTIAVIARLQLILRSTGGLFGLGNYDDGVHFAAALGLINGILPYRDFLLLHPPGVVLVLAPFAALSWLIGEPGAMAAARLSWTVLGGLNAVLCGLALRPLGRVAGIVGALFYALFLGAIYTEYTALLEPPATTLLLIAIVLTRLLGSGAGLGTWHYGVAGVLLGLSPVLKIWGVVAVLVVVGGILLRRGRRPAMVTLTAAVTTCAVVCLPFFLSAPAQMWRMVVTAQLSRRRAVVALAERLNDVLGVRVWSGAQPLWVPMTVVMLVVVLLALVVCLIRSELRVVAALLLTSGAIVLSTPMWFLHYAGLTAAPIALTVGGAVGAVLDWSRGTGWRTWARWAVGAVAVVGTLALAAPLPRWKIGNIWFPGPTMAAAVADRPGCVATDLPMALVQMNMLQRNIDRGCPLVVDVGGYAYYLVDSQFSDVSRRRNKDFQAVTLDYYRSADVVLPVRFSVRSGYSAATARTIAGWPVIKEVKWYYRTYTLREPQPARR